MTSTTRPGRVEYSGRAAVGNVPRIALSRAEAAESLGMSLDSFERYVQPYVRLVRRGRMRLVPVAELERWVDANAERTLERDSLSGDQSNGAAPLDTARPRLQGDRP
jgi:hypothetical protein